MEVEKVAHTLKNEPKFDINATLAELGVTPLISAIDGVSPKMVELLLEYGANPNLNSNKLPLPLLYTIELAEESYDVEDVHDENLIAIRMLLLKFGANPQQEDSDGENAYQYASKRYKIAKEIFDKNINSGNKKTDDI